MTEPQSGPVCREAWAAGAMAFESRTPEFLSPRKEGETARVSGAEGCVWLSQAGGGAVEEVRAPGHGETWQGGTHLGAAGDERGRNRAVGNLDPSLPPKTSVEHSVRLECWGLWSPPEAPNKDLVCVSVIPNLITVGSLAQACNASPPRIGSRREEPSPSHFSLSPSRFRPHPGLKNGWSGPAGT